MQESTALRLQLGDSQARADALAERTRLLEEQYREAMALAEHWQQTCKQYHGLLYQKSSISDTESREGFAHQVVNNDSPVPGRFNSSIGVSSGTATVLHKQEPSPSRSESLSSSALREEKALSSPRITSVVQAKTEPKGLGGPSNSPPSDRLNIHDLQTPSQPQRPSGRDQGAFNKNDLSNTVALFHSKSSSSSSTSHNTKSTPSFNPLETTGRLGVAMSTPTLSGPSAYGNSARSSNSESKRDSLNEDYDNILLSRSGRSNRTSPVSNNNLSLSAKSPPSPPTGTFTGSDSAMNTSSNSIFGAKPPAIEVKPTRASSMRAASNINYINSRGPSRRNSSTLSNDISDNGSINSSFANELAKHEFSRQNSALDRSFMSQSSTSASWRQDSKSEMSEFENEHENEYESETRDGNEIEMENGFRGEGRDEELERALDVLSALLP